MSDGFEKITPELMMDEFDRWVIRLLKLIVAVILLILYLLAIAWWISPPPPPRRVVVQPEGAEKRRIEARHKYHNIWISIEENGEHYFYRNGKKCKL